MLIIILHKFLLIYYGRKVRRDVFQAIADPTRRQIIELISNEAMTLNAIATHLT